MNNRNVDMVVRALLLAGCGLATATAWAQQPTAAQINMAQAMRGNAALNANIGQVLNNSIITQTMYDPYIGPDTFRWDTFIERIILWGDEPEATDFGPAPAPAPARRPTSPAPAGSNGGGAGGGAGGSGGSSIDRINSLVGSYNMGTIVAQEQGGPESLPVFDGDGAQSLTIEDIYAGDTGIFGPLFPLDLGATPATDSVIRADGNAPQFGRGPNAGSAGNGAGASAGSSGFFGGSSFTSVAFEPIYQNYDPFAGGSAWTSLDLYPPGPSLVSQRPVVPDWYSPSSAGISLPLDWISLRNPNDPVIAGETFPLTDPRRATTAQQWLNLANPWDVARVQTNTLLAALQAFRATRPDNVRDNILTVGGDFAGTTSGLTAAQYLRLASAGDLSGLNRLLAQPFNIVLTWGTGVSDADLHLTGPDGSGGRFHVYYANRGSTTQFPFAQLVTDCICISGSEALFTTQLLQGGVYRVSAFNFGDQSSTSTGLATGGLSLQIVRGGTAQSVGNGTTIVGGRTLLTLQPTGGAGNTWLAAEIDPRTGRIFTINQIGNTDGSGNVR